MKVVVFGGSGFLGSHVADVLAEAGHTVTIYDKIASPYLRPGQEMVVGDILDEGDVEAALKGADILYNFAGLADIDESYSKPIETVKYNILGNTILLEAARKQKIKRFVYASTVYVYSSSGSFYRCSKAACENYIEMYHKQYGLNYTILRYGTLYGARTDSKNSVYRFIRQAMTEGRITYPGDGNELREYINVHDAALGSIEILVDEFRNDHVILAGHYPIKVNDLFIMIREMLGKDIIIEYVPPPPNAPAEHYALTPYTFIPRVGKKYLRHSYTDLGQGLLICMQDCFTQMNDQRLPKGT